MAQFKIETKADSLVIIHMNEPKFKVWLGEVYGDWINRVEWIDDIPEADKQEHINSALQWYEDQLREDTI